MCIKHAISTTITCTTTHLCATAGSARITLHQGWLHGYESVSKWECTCQWELHPFLPSVVHASMWRIPDAPGTCPIVMIYPLIVYCADWYLPRSLWDSRLIDYQISAYILVLWPWCWLCLVVASRSGTHMRYCVDLSTPTLS